jgi:hypothetical protein
MSTRNQLDWQALGSQPVMPKNLPHHGLAWEFEFSFCPRGSKHSFFGLSQIPPLIPHFEHYHHIELTQTILLTARF